MSEIAQVRRIMFNDERIGMGFNSGSGLAVGTALEVGPITADPVADGQNVAASISVISSHEELMERIGMSFEAEGRYGFVSGAAKAAFSESTNYNSTSTFVVATCVVKNPFKRGSNFHLTGSAEELLRSQRLEEFETAYGDSFVRGLQTGGEYYAVVRITSVSESTQFELGASLSAEAQGLVASGSFKATFEVANSSASTRSEYEATMYQQAGSGATISPTVEIGEVIDRYKRFPEIARDSAAAYQTEVATYNTLPLPLPTPEEQEAFTFALADARQRKLRYIQLRNDLEFALLRPAFFRDLPPRSEIQQVMSAYTTLISAVQTHAVRLSRGEFEIPVLFDPGRLNPPIVEPVPIERQRALPEAQSTIPVVSLVGQDVSNIDACRQLFSGQTPSIDLWLQWVAEGTGLADPVKPYPTDDQLRFMMSSVNFIQDPPAHHIGDGYVKIVGQFPRDGLVPAGTDIVLQLQAA
jgi:hypothetical protein